LFVTWRPIIQLVLPNLIARHKVVINKLHSEIRNILSGTSTIAPSMLSSDIQPSRLTSKMHRIKILKSVAESYAEREIKLPPSLTNIVLPHHEMAQN
jgi:hypothetical protein